MSKFSADLLPSYSRRIQGVIPKNKVWWNNNFFDSDKAQKRPPKEEGGYPLGLS